MRAAGNSIRFQHTNGFSRESVKVFETENVSTWRGLEPSNFGFMPHALTFWAIRARHVLSHVLNTGSGAINIFEVKLTFDMLTVRGQQHSFSSHERVFLWKCQRFWDRKCLDLRGARTPNLRIHAKCSNPSWISNYTHYNVLDELLIHSYTSTVQPLKFRNG